MSGFLHLFNCLKAFLLAPFDFLLAFSVTLCLRFTFFLADAEGVFIAIKVPVFAFFCVSCIDPLQARSHFQLLSDGENLISVAFALGMNDSMATDLDFLGSKGIAGPNMCLAKTNIPYLRSSFATNFAVLARVVSSSYLRHSDNLPK